jgi:hypothetical protein
MLQFSSFHLGDVQNLGNGRDPLIVPLIIMLYNFHEFFCHSRENSSRTFLAPYFWELEKVPVLVLNSGNKKKGRHF